MRNENIIDTDNSLFSELLQAVQSGDEKHIVTLIERGVDIEQDGNRALMLACQLGHTPVVKLLIDADANIYQNNNEALWQAVANRHAVVTAVLLAEGADYMDRDGAIWEEATKPQAHPDGLTAISDLNEESLSEMDWTLLLDNALSQNNQLLADVLAQALPREKGPDAVVVALSHGNTSIAQQLLTCGVDFKQDGEKSAEAYYEAWYKGCKTLLPQLRACGATTSGALNEYYYGSDVSVNDLDNGFLAAMLKISEYEHETCESVAELAIPEYLDIAAEAISHLSEYPDTLKSLFELALLHNAKALYPQLMALKAGISFHYDDGDWLHTFITSCTDKTLISYLIAEVGAYSLQECGKLVDKAIEEKDLPWAKHLICFGLRPSQSYDSVQDVTALIESIEQDKPYRFSVYLHAAEQGGNWAISEVAKMYMEGNGINQNKQQAAYWYTQAAKSGNIHAMLRLSKMLASGDGIEQNKPQAIHWFRMLANDGLIHSLLHDKDEDVLNRIERLSSF